ncbi:prepilin-type N-terminal cleavage/methylation domain-containing protein [Puniceicoccus vermicola]|uniref:Prepilin-type N-terminal cleavage/methylation domain-containing protein n=1 Tax=Puniceicoccus vermicola TaxID=388746 RepID=A0A7X1B0J8_9BACT|nr:prepilin-type N-terminal cleavage/methylation domain-containing protein [Puniceicoccus vermicola]
MRRKNGFSLVELLVVMAVVGLLVAITVPVIHSMRKRSENTECASKLRTLGLAGLSWINENNGNMLDSMFWRAPVETNSGTLLPYLGFTNDQLGTEQPTPLSCPASFAEVGPNPDWNRSYSINIYACASENNKRKEDGLYSRNVTNIFQIEQPSRMAFFMDGNFLASGAAERKAGVQSVSIPWNENTKTGFYNQHPGNTFNVVFMDGHVDSLTLEDLPTGSDVEKRTSPFFGSLR